MSYRNDFVVLILGQQKPAKKSASRKRRHMHPKKTLNKKHEVRDMDWMSEREEEGDSSSTSSRPQRGKKNDDEDEEGDGPKEMNRDHREETATNANIIHTVPFILHYYSFQFYVSTSHHVTSNSSSFLSLLLLLLLFLIRYTSPPQHPNLPSQILPRLLLQLLPIKSRRIKPPPSPSLPPSLPPSPPQDGREDFCSLD